MAIQAVGNADPQPSEGTRSLPPDQPKGGGESSLGDREIAEQLTEAFGIEMPEESDGASLGDFMADVRKEAESKRQAEAPAQAPAETQDEGFVHEPTGKRFKTELELLRYDSGFNNDKLGRALQELRAENAALKESMQQTRQSPSYTPTRDDIKQALWPSRSAKELSEDAASDFVMEAVNNATNLLNANVERLLQARDQEIAGLRSTIEEMGARSEHRVDPSVESRFIEQYPGLAKLPPAERVAVIAGLAQQQTAAEQANGQKLAGKIPALKASDHVETSAHASQNSADDDLDEDAVLRRFDKIDDPRKELSILGDLVRRQRSFAGYEVDY